MSKSDPIFDKLALLERLEEIREELDELGITSLDELRQRIDNLEAEIDDAGADGDNPVVTDGSI